MEEFGLGSWSQAKGGLHRNSEGFPFGQPNSP
ncbi:hypothetical protein AKJ16_DCAP27467 [Drosera capensis]